MIKDFDNLMLMKAANVGTFEGDKEEFNMSRLMNKNKNHKFWDVLSKKCSLCKSKEDYYIVKVDGNKKSALTNKKVRCKSDNFIIKAKIDGDYLLQCEYQITENMLKHLDNYEIIDNSGISVKRADSVNYTIIKLTNNTFKEAFEQYVDKIDLIMGGLILYSDKKKISKNSKIIKDLNITEEDLKKFYSKRYNIKGDGILDVDFMRKISKKAKEVVKQVIEENRSLKASLFNGEGWFENPYYINFIFKYGTLTNDVYSNYTISNGSGRSKGKYTIILKPQ